MYTTIAVPGAVSTQVFGVDNAGEAIGVSTNAKGASNLFIESNSSYKIIQNPIDATKFTYMSSCDGAGDIAGSYVDLSDNIYNFIWNRSSDTFTTVLGFSPSFDNQGHVFAQDSAYGAGAFISATTIGLAPK